VRLLAQDKVARQELYKEFIETATQCYADALQHEKPDIPGLVNLYGKIGRMRVLSSPKVLASAEQIGQKITNMYLVSLRRSVERIANSFVRCAAKAWRASVRANPLMAHNRHPFLRSNAQGKQQRRNCSQHLGN
jgi:hypothetical protein